MCHENRRTGLIRITPPWSAIVLGVITIAVLVVSPAKAQTLLRTFDDPTVTNADNFGHSVAIDGSNVLIGALGDDTYGHQTGQAYLFDATTGALLQTFNNPTAIKRDFGDPVAIDGNNVLIGATGDDTKGLNVGQAYLFDATTGNLLQTFDDPTVTTSDGFASSIAIGGNSVLIGAPRNDTAATNVGQAYLFDATTGNLLRTFNDPTVTTEDRFGISVAIDGNNVLIGADYDDTAATNVGQAYLFDATTGSLLQTFDDPTVTTEDRFGSSVAIDGNNVLIGAVSDTTNGSDVGQAHLFDATTGALLQTFNDPTVTTTDYFGYSAVIDGNNVLIGAHLDDTKGENVGQAHLFEVPEPATLSMLALGGLAVLRRRLVRS